MLQREECNFHSYPTLSRFDKGGHKNPPSAPPAIPPIIINPPHHPVSGQIPPVIDPHPTPPGPPIVPPPGPGLRII